MQMRRCLLLILLGILLSVNLDDTALGYKGYDVRNTDLGTLLNEIVKPVALGKGSIYRHENIRLGGMRAGGYYLSCNELVFIYTADGTQMFRLFITNRNFLALSHSEHLGDMKAVLLRKSYNTIGYTTAVCKKSHNANLTILYQNTYFQVLYYKVLKLYNHPLSYIQTF